MKVIHFNRKPRVNANYSIEGFYKNIRSELNSRLDIKSIECSYESNGLFKRIYNIIYASFKQKDVNHITGDVNYLNLFFRKHKTILTVLDCGLLDRLSGIKLYIAKLLWYSIPIAKSKYIVAISNSTKCEILKYVKCNPDKIKVIYVSISPIFHKVEKTFNKTKPILLLIGTTENKNLKRHIRAINGLECKLNIIGVLSNEIIKELHDNNIDYENFVNLTDEQVFKQYIKCDILLFASTYEGFGMPIIEANSVGRPVITSNLLSMPEVAGDAACIVDPYDVEAIRKGILKIINDDDYRNELIREGYENIKRFELKNVAEQYLNLYQNILSEGI